MSALRRRGALVGAAWALAWALASTPAEASAEPVSGVRIAQMLRHWDVVAAEEALAAQVGDDDVGLEMLRAQLRFYQGDYDAALAGIDALDDRVDEGDLEWKRFIQEVVAAKEETKDHVEVRTPDGHFVIRHPPGPDAVLAPLMFDALPKMRARLGEKFGLLPDHPVVVEVYPTSASLGHVTGLGAEAIEN